MGMEELENVIEYVCLGRRSDYLEKIGGRKEEKRKGMREQEKEERKPRIFESSVERNNCKFTQEHCLGIFFNSRLDCY